MTTWTFNRTSWIVRWYLWFYKADPDRITFCSLAWGSLFSIPLLPFRVLGKPVLPLLEKIIEHFERRSMEKEVKVPVSSGKMKNHMSPNDSEIAGNELTWSEWFDKSGGYHLMGHPDVARLYDPEHCPWCATHTNEEAELRRERYGDVP